MTVVAPVSDPYAKIPNLSGITAASQEQSRGGDPSRFFAPVGGGDSVTSRIWNVPRACVYRVAAGNIAASTTSAITWDTLAWDNVGMWDPNSPLVLRSKVTGLYECKARATWAGPSVGDRQVYFAKSDGTLWGDVLLPTSTIAGIMAMQTSCEIPMNAGDTLEVLVVQNSPGPLAFVSSSTPMRDNGFSMRFVSTIESENV